jgi:hypothetical protein
VDGQGDGVEMFKAIYKLGLEGRRLKEAQRAVQVGAIEGVVENQESKSTRCYAGIRWER